jgi:hypothetical protein
MPSTTDGPGKRETPAERARRVAGLREEVASGVYCVPAELVARSILRRVRGMGRMRSLRKMGLALGLQHQ